jgi:tetratricopeptide (TPR) repeat protein
MNRILLMMIAILPGSWVIAQQNEMVMQAYQKSSPVLWEQVVKHSAKQYEADKSDESLFVLAMNEYGLLNATMADKNEALFDQYIDMVDDHLDALEEANYRSAEVQALTSAVAGLKIAYSPWKGMLLGPKSGYLIDEAVSDQPDSPIVQKLLGNYLLFTPETWGGDLERAVQAYDEAIKGFEQSNEANHWMYMDALVWRGKALMKLGRNEEAVRTYEKVKDLAPDFTWVSEVLLPQAKKS